MSKSFCPCPVSLFTFWNQREELMKYPLLDICLSDPQTQGTRKINCTWVCFALWVLLYLLWVSKADLEIIYFRKENCSSQCFQEWRTPVHLHPVRAIWGSIIELDLSNWYPIEFLYTAYQVTSCRIASVQIQAHIPQFHVSNRVLYLILLRVSSLCFRSVAQWVFPQNQRHICLHMVQAFESLVISPFSFTFLYAT